MHQVRKLLLALLALGSGCSVLNSVGKSSASAPPAEAGIERIAIVGTNDIHGALLPQAAKTREPEGTAPTSYEAGGVAYLASEINALRAEWGTRMLWLDAGDEFQGTIESNSEQGAPMVQFFNLEGLNAAAIGNHEFDFGPGPDGKGPGADPRGALKARMREAKYPYLAANIVDKSTGQLVDFPDTFPSRIVHAGELNVGVIGLSTLETPKTTRALYVRGLEFAPLKESVVREAAALRRSGAQVVVLTAHVGLKCDPGAAPVGYAMRKSTDPQGQCGAQDEMVQLLHGLPSGTVDAVVSGHSHQIVHHWVAGVPVVQGGASGLFFNVIYLTYDWNQKKVVPDKTRIEGPIPVCPQFFKNQHDCNGHRDAPAGGRGPLVAAEFRGKPVLPDPAVEELLKPVRQRSAKIKARVVGQAARPLDHPRFAESELGNLVADAIRVESKADISLMNSGGIRAPIEAGPITYGQVFQSMPFDNNISIVDVTGDELKLLLRVAEAGSRGFASFSGLKLKVLDREADAPSNDLNGNGRIEPWEVNRLLDARLADGAEIQPKKIYKLATIDFLVQGGDDLGFIFSKIPASRIQIDSGKVCREAVVDYITRLSAKSPINTISAPLVDAHSPRIEIVKPKTKASRRGHGRRHRRRHK